LKPVSLVDWSCQFNCSVAAAAMPGRDRRVPHRRKIRQKARFRAAVNVRFRTKE